MAVGIFFAISGFLAYYVLYRDEASTGAISYSAFLYRRILRIWPAYIAILLFVYAVGQFDTAARWLGLLTFTSNIDMARFGAWPPAVLSPLWSIAVEEQFYVLAPIMYRLLRSRWCVVFCVGVLLVSGCLRIFYVWDAGVDRTGNGGLYYATYAYADTFLAGAIVAHSYVRKGAASLSWRRFAMVVGISLIAYLLLSWPGTVFPPYGSLMACVPYWTLPVAAGALIFSVLPSGDNNGVMVLLGSEVMTGIGRLSYSLYLVHLLALHKVGLATDQDFWLRNTYVLALALGLALLLHYLVERPFLRLKDVNSSVARWMVWPLLAWLPLLAGAGIQLYR